MLPDSQAASSNQGKPVPGQERDRKGRKKGLFAFSLPIQAFIIQMPAFLLALTSFEALYAFFAYSPNIFVFGIVQGLFAALIARWRKMPFWLLVIQLLLPVAMLVLLALQLSPIWYFSAFLALLMVFWGALFRRVPLYLSGVPAWDEVLGLIPEKEDVQLKMLDIGSGIGGPALYFARRRPDISVTGVEIAPFLWLISRIRKAVTKSPARFLLKNYEKIHFGEYDLLFAYLSPVVMDSLWEKAVTEMKPGSLFLSYEFEVAGVEPQIRIEVGKKILYGWRI